MLELLASEFRPMLQTAFALLVCLAALLWGRGPERAIAITWLVLFEAALHLRPILFAEGFRVTGVDLLLASVDALAVVIFILIALNANRIYPLCIAAAQILAVAAHLARGMIEAISPIAYAIMVIGPGWFQLMFFAAGLARHITRERRFGRYRDWRIPPAVPSAVPLGARGS
ncbi:MAG: hypothetical protein V2I27_01765 [Erythrobacter sp.]|jgi:hypothetical protein|nr:hypothetical protein [Erythrobacter sp.]